MGPEHTKTLPRGKIHIYGPQWTTFGALGVLKGVKRGQNGPERPFWGSPRVLEGPRGPDLVQTAANWSDWVGVMVTTHFAPVLGLPWAPRGPQKGPFWPRKTLLGVPEGLGGPPGGQIWEDLGRAGTLE